MTTSKPRPRLPSKARTLRLYLREARLLAKDLRLSERQVRELLMDARLLPEERERRERIAAHVRRVASARRSAVVRVADRRTGS